MGLDLDELQGLGRANPADADEPFNMAYLAMHGAGAVNGVSRLHGEVSRGIFHSMFPNWPEHEVPVGYVTNGIHVPSWESAAADALWNKACDKSRWRGTLESVEEDLRQLPDEMLWSFRTEGRQQLIKFLRQRLERQYRGRGAARERIEGSCEILDPDTLTLGFARRFAEYKRPNLLLRAQQP
jgi:starch phosphorylase